MHEYNCDSLKKLPVSDELMKKALAIPETANKPAAVPWYRQNRAVATAASVVLVTVIGFSLYFIFGNIKRSVAPVIGSVPVASAPSTAADESLPPTGEPSDSMTAAIDGTQKPSQPVTEPSSRFATDAAGRIAPSATTPTGAAESAPAVPQQSEATQKSHPTQRATEQPPIPTSAPKTEPDTLPPPQETEPADPDPTVEPWEPIAEPNTDLPEPIEPTDAALTFRETIRVSDPAYSGKIYCRIYDRDRGIVLGDPDRYAQSHRADYTVNGAMLTVVYRPSEHGITVPPGRYAIAFHNERGKLLIGGYYTVH